MTKPKPNLSILAGLVQELEAKLEASKGGNVPGVTEDHRFEMSEQLSALRGYIAGLSANETTLAA